MAGVVFLRVRVIRCDAESCRLADGWFEHMPVWPHERLVVEPGWQESLQHAQRGAHIEFNAWPTIDARCNETVVQLDLGGLQVCLRALRARLQLHNGVRLISTSSQNASGPMQLETPADYEYPVRQQCGSERVPFEALVRFAVEYKGNALVFAHTRSNPVIGL